MQVATNVNATRHREQSRQQDDERYVFGKQGMHRVGPSCRRAEHQREGHQESQAPCRSHFAVMVVPEVRQQQRHQGNGQQEACERHAPDRRQLSAVKLGGPSPAGQGQQHRQNQPSGPSCPQKLHDANLQLSETDINGERCRIRCRVRFQTPGADKPSISRHHTYPCPANRTIWPQAGRCNGSS